MTTDIDIELPPVNDAPPPDAPAIDQEPEDSGWTPAQEKIFDRLNSEGYFDKHTNPFIRRRAKEYDEAMETIPEPENRERFKDALDVFLDESTSLTASELDCLGSACWIGHGQGIWDKRFLAGLEKMDALYWFFRSGFDAHVGIAVLVAFAGMFIVMVWLWIAGK